MSDPNITINPGHEVGPDQIRIYICQTDKLFIPIPSDGVPPYKYDYLLHSIEDKHGFRGHEFAIVAVTKKAWEDPEGQKLIVRQLKEAIAGGETGFGHHFYDVKDQFKEDAMTCWKAHNRTYSCDDFHADKMRLQPDTRAERKSEGLGKYQSNIFLCSFCPVNSLVEQRIRQLKVEKGLY